MMRHNVQVYRDNAIGCQKCKETRTNGANNWNLNLFLSLRLFIKLPSVEEESELTVPLQNAKWSPSFATNMPSKSSSILKKLCLDPHYWIDLRSNVLCHFRRVRRGLKGELRGGASNFSFKFSLKPEVCSLFKLSLQFLDSFEVLLHYMQRTNTVQSLSFSPALLSKTSVEAIGI